MSDSSGTVHLVDDDESIRSSISFLLETVGTKCVVYADPLEFLESFRDPGNACLVVDIRMPGMSGLELQDQLNDRGISNPLIFITGHGEINMAVRAMRNGAFDFIQKPFRDQDLLDSINAGLQMASSAQVKSENEEVLRRRYLSLSPREKEVMKLVANGKANKVIAYELDVSQRTVEIHRARAMQKMHVRNLADLVRADIQLEKLGAI